MNTASQSHNANRKTALSDRLIFAINRIKKTEVASLLQEGADPYWPSSSHAPEGVRISGKITPAAYAAASSVVAAYLLPALIGTHHAEVPIVMPAQVNEVGDITTPAMTLLDAFEARTSFTNVASTFFSSLSVIAAEGSNACAYAAWGFAERLFASKGDQLTAADFHIMADALLNCAIPPSAERADRLLNAPLVVCDSPSFDSVDSVAAGLILTRGDYVLPKFLKTAFAAGYSPVAPHGMPTLLHVAAACASSNTAGVLIVSGVDVAAACPPGAKLLRSTNQPPVARALSARDIALTVDARSVVDLIDTVMARQAIDHVLSATSLRYSPPGTS